MRILASSVIELTEAAYDAKTGLLSVTVIKPGLSKNNRNYAPDMLRRDAHIFEGVKMFADHQTAAELKIKPEGSVNNWVAQLGKVVTESDGTVKAKAQVIDPPFKEKLDMLASKGLLHEMGISIRAIGEATESTREGKPYTNVDSLLKARSVDFVTYAGAGGMVEAMESDSNNQNDVDLMTEAQLRDRRPDIIELIEAQFKGETMKTAEQLQTELTEAQTRLATATTLVTAVTAERDAAKLKITEAETTAAKAVAASALVKLLSESKLPEAAQVRIRSHFKDAAKVEGMQEAIVAEVEYIKTLGVKTTSVVRGVGAADNTQVEEGDKPSKEVHEALVAHYINLGMSKELAESATQR
jgi:hypothetical protein